VVRGGEGGKEKRTTRREGGREAKRPVLKGGMRDVTCCVTLHNSAK
jgi:hypothetical protein